MAAYRAHGGRPAGDLACEQRDDESAHVGRRDRGQGRRPLGEERDRALLDRVAIALARGLPKAARRSPYVGVDPVLGVLLDRDLGSLPVLAAANVRRERRLQIPRLGVGPRVALALLAVNAVGDHVGLPPSVDAGGA